MASIVSNKAKTEWAKGNINWGSDTVKIALVSAFSGTVDDDYLGSMTFTELNGTGYTKGHGSSDRKSLTCSVDEDDVNNRAKIRANQETWTAIDAGTVIGGIVHKAGASDDSDALFIAYIELASPKATNGGNLTFKFANDDGTEGDVVFFT